MQLQLEELIENCPVIAAVKDREELTRSLESESSILFLLFGDVCNIQEAVKMAKDAGKAVFVHMDLIAGLSSKDIAVDFIRNNTLADGIITTKASLVKRAKELGLYTVLRFFVIDSIALQNVARQTVSARPDLIEILPGLMPKVIRKICDQVEVPVIAGGLITDKEDIMSALSAGAVSISTTNEDVWFM